MNHLNRTLTLERILLENMPNTPGVSLNADPGAPGTCRLPASVYNTLFNAVSNPGTVFYDIPRGIPTIPAPSPAPPSAPLLGPPIWSREEATEHYLDTPSTRASSEMPPGTPGSTSASARSVSNSAVSNRSQKRANAKAKPFYFAPRTMSAAEEIKATDEDVANARKHRRASRSLRPVLLSEFGDKDVYSGWLALAKLKLQFYMVAVGPYLSDKSKATALKPDGINRLAGIASDLACADLGKTLPKSLLIKTF